MNDLSLEFRKKVIINVTFESISIYCGFAALKPVLTSNSLQIEAEAIILDCAKSQENDVDAMIINQLDVNAMIIIIDLMQRSSLVEFVSFFFFRSVC